jgi:hypothetical protein
VRVRTQKPQNWFPSFFLHVYFNWSRNKWLITIKIVCIIDMWIKSKWITFLFFCCIHGMSLICGVITSRLC